MLQGTEMQRIWWSATVVGIMLTGEIGNGGCGEGEHVPLPPWNAVASSPWATAMWIYFCPSEL